MFAAIAGRYDLNNRFHSFGRDQAWRRRAVRLCEVRPMDRVLDVACGTGDLAFAFARAGAASVVGLDFTEEMLEIARLKAARHAPIAGSLRDPGIASVDFLRGDAMELPFDDASFDIVSIAFGIRNVADPGRALRGLRRVLRPDGRLVVLEFSEPRAAPLRWLNRLYTRRIMPVTATLIAGDRSGAYKYLPASVSAFASADALAALLRAPGGEGGGFADVTSHPLTFGVCTAHLARV